MQHSDQYVSVIPSAQATQTRPDPYAPPNGDAQLTLFDYIALAAATAAGYVVGMKATKYAVQFVSSMA